MHGTGTLAVEVKNVSRHGFWLLLDTEELLLPFADFPWFWLHPAEGPALEAKRRRLNSRP